MLTISLVIQDQHVFEFLINRINIDLLALCDCRPNRIASILVPHSLMEARN